MVFGSVSPYNRNTTRDPFKGLNQNIGQQGNQNRLQGFDPRDIMQGDAFQRLMQMGQAGPGGYNTAREVMQPSLDYYGEMLGNAAPLGSGRGQLVRNVGYGAVSSQLENMGRQVRESSTQFGRASDPEAAAWSQQMVRNRSAGAYGAAEQNAQMADLNERQMNEQFRAGIASSLSGAGMGLAGLRTSDFQARVGATGQALQSESFARNTAAELMTRIMGYGSRGGGGNLPFSLEDRGRLREKERQKEFGHLRSPFEGMSQFGPYGGSGFLASDYY